MAAQFIPPAVLSPADFLVTQAPQGPVQYDLIPKIKRTDLAADAAWAKAEGPLPFRTTARIFDANTINPRPMAQPGTLKLEAHVMNERVHPSSWFYDLQIFPEAGPAFKARTSELCLVDPRRGINTKDFTVYETPK